LRALNAAGLLALLGFTVPGVGGCGTCGTPSGSGAAVDAAQAEAMDPPVPAPEGLLAEAWLRAPDATWSKIQRGVSGAVALLPPTVGELACAFAGLDSPLSQLLDGKATAYLVLGDGGAAGPPAWVVALPLTSSAAAATMLFDGGDAASAKPRYTARDVGGMRLLSSADRPPTVTAALARGSPGWLVLASGEADLARLGPYAVRTMPTKAAPSEVAALVADVPQAALAGALSSWVGARWGQTRAWLEARDDEQRSKHGGRAPDFGDPRPVVAALDRVVKGRSALLAQARTAHLVIDAGDDDVHAELLVTPGADEASAGLLGSMTPGDARPLDDVPADAALAVLVREGSQARTEDATALMAMLDQALGDRLHEDDARALHTAITDWVRARGDWWTGALAWGDRDAARGLWVRAPATTADESMHAVRELVDLSHRRPLQDLLATSLHLGPASVTSVDTPPLGKVSLATFVDLAASPRKPDASGALGVAWGMHDSELLVAAGPMAPQLLLTESAPPKRLGDDPRSAGVLAALGSNVTLAVFAQPLRFEAAHAADSSAPAVIAWGRKGDGLWGRLDLADTLLRELLRLNAGL